MRHLQLSGGGSMPALGLGTWKAEPGEVGAAVREAVRLGYRHVDCASIYGNEREIGVALAECIAKGWVRREELWVTSKLWNDSHAPGDVLPALRRTLADLRLESLDLYLIHWPVALRRGVLIPQSAADFVAPEELPPSLTWTAMEAAVEAGLVRHIGVSNFDISRLESLLASARIRPEVNQVELHPYLPQSRLVESCDREGIALTAYSPLGSPDRPPRMKGSDEPVLLADPVVAGVAERRGATPAQVLLAWAVQRGTAVIPKSVDPGRLRENLEAVALKLSQDDLLEIAALDRGRRYLDGAFWALPGSPYGPDTLWDD